MYLRVGSTLEGAVSQAELDALDTGLAENLSTYTTDLTIASGNSTVVCGPVIIPNLTVNGNLAVTTSLSVTTDLDIASGSLLNIIG